MNKRDLEKFAKQAAKNIKTEDDLNDFRAMLTKVTVEAALNAELDHHLGYSKHKKSNHDNHRNGCSSKTLKTDSAEFNIKTSPDRCGSFEPIIVK